MIMIVFLLMNIYVRSQTNWLSGPGTPGPVTDWGNRFWQSHNVTFNNQGQISPIATTVNPSAWTKRIIDSDPNIANNAIWPADFDNDGNIDLVGWKSYSGQLVFYRNDGNNNFSQIAIYYPGPSRAPWAFIYANDLNNDGWIDVVVPCGDAGTGSGLYWYRNNGTPNFSFTSFTISTNRFYFFIDGADIDNDRDIDLVATRGYGGYTEIWQNNGNGSFTWVQSLAGDIWRAAFGDLNNDGWVDLVLGDNWRVWSSDKNYKIYLNNRTGIFNLAATIANELNNDALWIRDMDNDGYLDINIAVMDSSSPSWIKIWWMKNLGNGVHYIQHTVYDAGNTLYGDGGCAEDFDFDGKADVAMGFRQLAWFRQISPNNFTTYVIDAPTANIRTHWVFPVRLGGTGCFRRWNVDLVVCWHYSFVLYENNMVQGFEDGWLESSVLKAECGDEAVNWLYFGWDVCCPFNNAVTFQVRSGRTFSEIISKPWSPAIIIPPVGDVRDSFNISSYTTVGDTLFQYRVNFDGATDAGFIKEVWVTYECETPTGIENEIALKEGIKVYSDKICYSLNKEKEVRLALYDIAGRLVKILDYGKKSKGNHWITIPHISNGIYFVVFNIDNKNITKKIVMIR